MFGIPPRATLRGHPAIDRRSPAAKIYGCPYGVIVRSSGGAQSKRLFSMEASTLSVMRFNSSAAPPVLRKSPLDQEES